ncbi:hypothetical protein ACWATR_08885 [Nostoc sp. UIC 10890]
MKISVQKWIFCDRTLHITRNKQDGTGVGFGCNSRFILDLS